MATPTTTAGAPSGAPAPSQQRPTKSSEISERLLAKFFLSPSFFVLGVFALLPVFYALFTSLYEIRGVRSEFTGLGNYATALTDPTFWRAFVNTALFSIITVALEFIIGMAFALIMNKAFRGRGITRAIILVPWVIPTAIAAQVWYYMFSVRPGFMNTILGTEGLNWVTTAPYDFLVMIIADVWKTAPFVALLLLAGLQTIPGEVYEAGKVDGANARQTFWRITMPLLRPAIVIALLFRSIDALRMYDLSYIIGGFGNESTIMLSVYVQQYVVRSPEAGYAATLAILTFILLMAIGVGFISRLGKDIISDEGAS